jgi:putative FmdB family regulatory protein
MPIFEYTCNACGNEFETLVRGSETATCPSCSSEDLAKRFSIPALKTEGTHNLAMRAAKKRDRIQGRTNVEEQRLYEQAHEASEGI